MEKYLQKALWYGRFSKFFNFIGRIATRVFNYSMSKALEYSRKQQIELNNIAKKNNEPKVVIYDNRKRVIK